MGVTDVEFLGCPDGKLMVSLELRRDITRVIRRKRPDRMVVPSPNRDLRSVHRSHPDHRAAGEEALCAVYPDAAIHSRISNCSPRKGWQHTPFPRCG